MTNLELLLDKHAKKFIDVKHSNKAVRGILFDGEGAGYATDAIQALKVKGLVPVGFPWVKGLNGKPIKEEPTHLDLMQKLFSGDLEHVATVEVKELLDAAKLLHSVQKEDLRGQKKEVRDQYRVGLTGDGGKLHIRYRGFEVVGSVEVGTSEDFNLIVNCKRLIDCLSVFEKEFETVELSSKSTALRIEAGNVSVILLPFGKE